MHPTVKPVLLVDDAIKDVSKRKPSSSTRRGEDRPSRTRH